MNNKNTTAISTVIEENVNFVEGDEFYIYGEFDFTITKFIIPRLVTAVQNARNMKDAIIRFYIDSPGGFVHILQNMLSLIEMAKNQGTIIETNVFSYAYSCASILAAAGSPGRRFVSPFAEHLAHLGQASSGIVVNDTEVERMTIKLKSHFNFIRDCYKRYSKIPNIEEVIKDDNFYIRGNDIIKYGLADFMLFEYPMEKAKKNESKKIYHKSK